MFRTFAVLLLLLGLATATPVVCLCGPSDVAGLAAGLVSREEQADPHRTSPGRVTGASSTADAPNLVATGAAAVVASLVATAGGVPSAMPWRPPRPVIVRWLPPPVAAPAAPTWSPAVPPPR